jgi:hypothetical protein
MKNNLNDIYQPHYYVEVFEIDGDMKDYENFKTLKTACKWAKEQVTGKNAPYYGYVSEVWKIDEYGDMEETGNYYGKW